MSTRIYGKRLEQDCLLAGRVHPSVARRLQRIRELPAAAAANFHGVERVADEVVLLWSFIPGRTLEEFMAGEKDGVVRRRVARELEAAVASVHRHGIVHGALHERNVVIDRAGRVRLLHFSPLLWTDTRRDEEDLRRLVAQLGGHETPTDETDSDEDATPNVRAGVGRALLIAGIGLLISLALLFLVPRR